MSKKLNITSITNELSAGSAFFRPQNPQPPKAEQKPTPPPVIIPETSRPKPTPIGSSPIQEGMQHETASKPQAKPGKKNSTNLNLPKGDKFDKYSTYLRPGYKKVLKTVALERDCKDYEVLDEAITNLLRSLGK